MKINVRQGELITDVLFKQTGQDSDQLEHDFYQANPHVRGEVFSRDTLVTIPVVKANHSKQGVVRSWN
ncbi:hypothetical protein [Vibrio splendidus]|uniref:hypothetical protein n=1 Tax=Vibrio splendidus TaxID=29497 RepID=UPI000C83EC42|nr:hypothetical protein [Vibrio splendidus]PMI49580.1 hypothetical protein BCU42_14395 [Vibrio splendidus]